MEFNKNSRKKNVLLTSGSGMLNQLWINLIAFVYRTVFLYVLSIEYLGINGLFSNIINIFSLAELGVGSVIVYRLYEPIKRSDLSKTAALMRFYKQFYHLLAVGIAAAGVSLIPFLDVFIHDLNEVPSDVNIYVVYVLFVIQSVTSYLFVYKQSILNADQKGYIVLLVQTIGSFLRYSFQILFLLITKDFMITLTAGIFVNILFNAGFSIYITRTYAELFKREDRLEKQEKKEIFKDTFALLCHNIGQTVVFSTDNLILSSFVGTIAVGIYSNYSLIINAVSSILKSLLGTFTSSIGNYKLSASSEEVYGLYKKLHFVNMWAVSFCASSLYLLLNPFISVVWNGKKILFSNDIIVVLCISFFISASRVVNGSFVNGCGLFVRDKIRPLIESTINLVVSIVLVRRMGTAGVFWGTIISSLLTVWWREPYILYHELFKVSLKNYMAEYFGWLVLSLTACWGIQLFFQNIPLTTFFLIVRFVACAVVINLYFMLITWKTKSFQYYKDLLWSYARKKKKKIQDRKSLRKNGE